MQGFQLCVLDYDFMILDNAFLVHRPGIKTQAANLKQTQKDKVAAQNSLIAKTIIPGVFLSSKLLDFAQLIWPRATTI